MWTLALRGGARVAVVEEEWYDAFGVVTCGRVQLELRDGRPGPVLGRDAGFWLRGTGVRALRNPGHRTARVRVVTPQTTTVTCPSSTPPMSATDRWRNDMNGRRHRGLVVTGLVATVVAMAVNALAAALARAVGVDFEVGGETIPVSGIAVVTGFFSVVGVVIALVLLRWSGRPAERFVRTAVSLTAISLVPPLVSEADPATIAALVGLHLIAATVMIPALAGSLRAR